MNIFLFLFNTIIGDYMKLRDVVSKGLIFGDVSDSASKVSEYMRDNDVGFVPILEGNHVVGIITDRDMACRIFDNNDFFCSITDYMSRDVVSVDINSDISDVLNLMKKHRIKRVIVTECDNVFGVISISDLLPVDSYRDEIFDTIRAIWEIGPNKHKYETEIDEFYL